MAQEPTVAIIELGSQYTLLIERTLRELGTRSVILEPKRAGQWLTRHPAKAIILSGGAASVYQEGAPQPPEEIFSASGPDSEPPAILGICYGMQWLARRFGGEVEPVADKREYGQTSISVIRSSHLMFDELPETMRVWMSHGDSVTRVPADFEVLARTTLNGTIAAMGNGRIWGAQFHPEVTHTAEGKAILGKFLRMARCPQDWQPHSIINAIRENVSGRLGTGKAVFGFSGGVDSTTVSAILAPTLGERLLALTIDGGHLREGELDEIKLHAQHAKVNLKVVDARAEFAEAMAGITDAEEKRHQFKSIYARIFVREARAFGATAVIQGTLAPDRIESGATGGAIIKSHHNVGLDMGKLMQLHPIDHLFKYEVRALAQHAGLPESVWQRQPFPGPGLFIRIVGVPATPNNLEIVRWADAQVRNILTSHKLYHQVSQLVVAYMGVNTVGVKGDERVYGGAIVVRAVETSDFMTANGVHFPASVEDEISTELTKHPAIVRVWFDFTRKPPATTEME